FDEATAVAFVERFGVLVDGMSLNPDTPALDIVAPLPAVAPSALDNSGAVDESPSVPAPRAPITPVDELLLVTWAEVLGLPAEEVTLEDNFFELGGHSLLATQLLNRVRSVFQVEVSLQVLYWGGTPSDMVKEILAAGNPTQLRARAEVLLEISRMSDSEVRHRLGNEES
ncbi:phosphopantetheine-binding protein, partial [Melissospora conviva]|uniref:phosphopantetheine-binding protein n=1 Tax=Melissospora conviva TaxID=3388432 RepID=UPI003C1EE781